MSQEIRTIQCFVCRQEVSIGKTVPIGSDRRACKKHPGILKEAKVFRKKEKVKALAEDLKFNWNLEESKI